MHTALWFISCTAQQQRTISPEGRNVQGALCDRIGVAGTHAFLLDQPSNLTRIVLHGHGQENVPLGRRYRIHDWSVHRFIDCIVLSTFQLVRILQYGLTTLRVFVCMLYVLKANVVFLHEGHLVCPLTVPSSFGVTLTLTPYSKICYFIGYSTVYVKAF